MLILQARDQFPKYKHKMCAKQSPLFPMLMCKLLQQNFQNKLYFNEVLFSFYYVTICKYCQYSATLGKLEILIFYENN